MLNYPNLNDQELESVIAAAVDRLRAEEGEWSPSGISDPGLFLLELLARLKCAQQKYIDTIGVKSFRRIAALLGMSQGPVQAAVTYFSFMPSPAGISAEGNRLTEENQLSEEGRFTEGKRIAEGSRLSAGDLLFETKETLTVQNARLTAIGHPKDGGMTLEALRTERGEKGYVLLPYGKEESVCYLCFDRRLQEQVPISFYFELTKELAPRTPVDNPEQFIPLSETVWEYYGADPAEPFHRRWQKVQVLRDETLSFLFSGRVTVMLPAKQELWEGKSLLRVRAEIYGYEREPKISKIHMNCIPAIQQRTLCKQISFSVREIRENKMYLEHRLAEDGCWQLFLKEGHGYLPAEALGFTYLVKKTEGRFRLGTSDRAELLSRLQNRPEEEPAFLLLLYDREFYPNRFLGSGTGIGNQTVSLRSSGTVLAKTLKLLIRHGEVWEAWEQTADLEMANANDRVFLYSESSGKITFGDNIHGRTPYLGKDTICLAGGAETAAERGNIREGAGNGWFVEQQETGIQREIWIEQFLEASGGCSEESMASFQMRVKAEKDCLQRAVTTADYEKLAAKTPGLKLLQVTAVPLYRPGIQGYPKQTEENAITLIIEADRDRQITFSPERYLENVRRWMEPYRLLTTKLYFMTPRFFGLELTGEAVISGGYEAAKTAIFETLEEYLAGRENGKPGGILSHGDLCGRLELLDCVEQVEYLVLEVIPSVSRNRQGDLLLPPYGRVYLKNNGLHMRKAGGRR